MGRSLLESDIGKLTPKNKEKPGRQKKGLEAEVNRSVNIDHSFL